MTEEVNELSIEKGRTSRCSRFDHPEIAFYFDPSIVMEPWRTSFIRFLEDSVERGSKFKPGESIQIGWLIDKFVEADGELSIQEPAFEKNVAAWKNEVTNTLMHLHLQKYVAESIGLESEMDFPKFVQTGIVCDRFKDSSEFMMHRLEPVAHNEVDSGWFVGCLDEEHEHNSADTLRVAPLHEIAATNNRIIQYLALPTGSMLQEETNGILIFYGEEALEFRVDSYLHNRHAALQSFDTN